MKMTPKSQCPLYWTVLLYLSRELLLSMRNCSECAPLTQYWYGMQIFGGTEWTEAWSKRREWPKTALSSPSVGDQVFEEAYRAKRCSWYVQRAGVPCLWEERGETVKTLVLILPLPCISGQWSNWAKQTDRISCLNTQNQPDTSGFDKKPLLPRGSELLQIYSFCSFWSQSVTDELCRAAWRVSLLPLGNRCQHYIFRQAKCWLFVTKHHHLKNMLIVSLVL